MNVVVHCHAGICRSGAVVEVASMMGFTPADRLRIPNMRVKHKMMQVLGWTYGE
jgi:protein-tyrosine phosphatase